MPKRDFHLETTLVHTGEPRISGAATIPIFRSSVFEYKGEQSYHDVIYPRLNNLPNHAALCSKLAALEGGEDALVTGSGMAAISTTLLSVLARGGHLLVQDGVYGGTHNLLTDDLEDFGISYDFIDANDPASWASTLQANTRAIYVEAMSNPLLQVADHEQVVKFARQYNLVSIIDSTFATPINFRPIALGFDICLHSATKYLNGHSDLVAGVVVSNATWIDRLTKRLNHLGGCLDPQGCYLLQRGLKTLALRVRQQNHNGLAIARHLAARPEVSAINYPGLETHPHYPRSQKLFQGFGGMLSFELTGGAKAAERFISRLELIIHAPSLGGPETLVTRPVTTSHAGMAPPDRVRLGITDGLIRMSVGIEHTEDLIADVDRALAR